ncbi:gastrula zinc finger protein XlCGF57.1-like [Spodoptera litura]|uniref:Gastrula zinc finger protein XlCGF57.1-like n=1 Tax=Spodoptera litura TaxID=69820 RepID=A0A9J7DYA0_SPOLT|nr:gastrula zinc finger protein XlCGF57.1-like [Spodoptera litura]XP_022819043.1 gastrula zinc finger protein XlCGF57.1-like [Spodoptera litura]
MASRLRFEEDLNSDPIVIEIETSDDDVILNDHIEISDEDSDLEYNNVNVLILGRNKPKPPTESNLNHNNIDISHEANRISNRNKDSDIHKTSEIVLGQKSLINVVENIVDDSLSSNDSKASKTRKRPTELERLGADVTNRSASAEYDVYGDENQIFKKYKFRNPGRTSTDDPFSLAVEQADQCEDDVLVCLICMQEFMTIQGLKSHLRYHERIQKFTCSFCLKKFKSNSCLITHRNVHNSETFSCKQCELTFPNYCDYLLHKYTHNNDLIFKCLECDTLLHRDSFKQHVLTHFEKPMNGQCNVEKNIKSDFPYPCVECGKVCKNRRAYNYHISRHTGVKKYQCLYCGTGFRSKKAKVIHTLTHTGESKFICYVCGYKTNEFEDLFRHKQCHLESRGFTCGYCEKNYPHKSFLVNHMRCHFQIIYYPCDE